MDLNTTLMKLGELKGYPVAADMYEGEEEKYITFVYQDERPFYAADNKVQTDQADIYVNFYAPTNYDYMDDKHKIRDFLEESGAVVNSISSMVESYGANKVRHVLFDVRFIQNR